MTIDAAQAAIQLVIANALLENGEAGGRAFVVKGLAAAHTAVRPAFLSQQPCSIQI
jgi:hypothetical protein